MAKVPFTVSARAARLIGRENVASASGAVTELVKNCYDADARICAVLFKRRWPVRPSSLTAKELRVLERHNPGISTAFVQEEGAWKRLEPQSPEQKTKIDEAIDQVVDLWIVDNGHGMSTDVIEKQWMVIGTDSKEIDATSRGGRAYTGAKGIGRFALDRLGQECELYSAEEGSSGLIHWLVDWEEFDGVGKTISQVEAVLERENSSLAEIYRLNSVIQHLPRLVPSDGATGVKLEYKHGTAVKISFLSDLWTVKDARQLTETLDALLPPDERSDFSIFLYDERTGEPGVFIDNLPPDQFDYKLIADVRGDGTIGISINRQEIDVKGISDTVYSLDGMGNHPYRKEDFDAGKVSYETDLGKILRDPQLLPQARELGPFSFVMYFFKLTNPSSDVLKRFPQKNFDVAKRKRWIDRSGGVRLYRDGFRVRPYGEPRTAAADWLLLGDRALRNPAQASRMGWRAPPTQVAGTINITRRENPLLADRSNREGLVNERALDVFRNVVTGLIKEFERDRSYILGKFSAAYDIDNPQNENVREGKTIAKRVLNERARAAAGSTKGGKGNDSPNATDLQKVSLAFDEQVRENEFLRDHIQVMRGMATLGTVLISFTHELKQIKATVESRANRLSQSVSRTTDDAKLAKIPVDIRPQALIERMQSEDKKVSRWVNFALSAVSSSKRRRQKIAIGTYLRGVHSYWREFLESRRIELDIDSSVRQEVAVLAHEIDLDTIFYNLITNSIEALVKPSGKQARLISIKVGESGKFLRFSYSDNGPGLSSDINSPNDIFAFGISSKKEDVNGAASGTGLGMWLLKNVVDDVGGSVNLNSKIGSPGFSIEIDIPRYKAEG